MAAIVTSVPIVEFSNDGISTNWRPYVEEDLDRSGYYWRWAVFAIFATSWVTFVVLQRFARAGEKVFYYLFAIATFVALMTYFGHAVGFNEYAVESVLWAVAFPVIVIVLGIISGVTWATIMYNIVISWIWVISYLTAALAYSPFSPWGFFAFGTTAFLWLAFSTLYQARRFAARNIPSHTVSNQGTHSTQPTTDPASALKATLRDYTFLALWCNFLWLMYVIAWPVSWNLSIFAHAIWFGILDLLLIAGTGFGVMLLSRRWDYDAMRLDFTQHSRFIDRGHHDEHSSKEARGGTPGDNAALPTAQAAGGTHSGGAVPAGAAAPGAAPAV